MRITQLPRNVNHFTLNRNTKVATYHAKNADGLWLHMSATTFTDNQAFAWKGRLSQLEAIGALIPGLTPFHIGPPEPLFTVDRALREEGRCD